MSDTKPRRGFLKDATCLVAAASGVVGFAHSSRAESDVETAIDDVQAMDIGVRPALGCFGAVVIRRDKLVFATFPATGESGNGMALVAFSGCAACRSSGGLGDVSVPNAIDTDSLATGETYEVLNSSWAQAARPPQSGESGDANAPLRHFVFTFMGYHEQIGNGGRHFECLAEGLHAESLPPGPYLDVVNYADFLNACA